jgi:site-specific DNA-methyltransferase (adenine-specific)
MMNIVYNEDCMTGMARYPDKYFDVAIVDPPYGLGIDGQKLNNTNKNPKHNRKAHDFKGWDNMIPDKTYFDELFRVSKNQIVWGGNYFTEYLKPTKAWIFWYKGQNDLTMSDGELAWTSFEKVTRQITINRFAIKTDGSIHPTQKPIKLYRLLLHSHANAGDKILDTHVGSGSSRIACSKEGFDYTGFEIDADYWKAQEKRYADYKAQLLLF